MMNPWVGFTTSRAVAVLGLAVGIGAAVYWTAGAVVPNGGLDHFAGPYSVDVGLLRAVGVAAIAVGAVSFAALWRWRSARQLSTTWIILAGLVGVAAAITAFTWRVCTAGVTGANIGAPMLLSVAAACWIATLIGVLALAVRTARSALHGVRH